MKNSNFAAPRNNFLYALLIFLCFCNFLVFGGIRIDDCEDGVGLYNSFTHTTVSMSNEHTYLGSNSLKISINRNGGEGDPRIASINKFRYNMQGLQGGYVEFYTYLTSLDDITSDGIKLQMGYYINGSGTFCYYDWRIPKSLLVANKWQHIKLKITGTGPTLSGSTVDGVTMVGVAYANAWVNSTGLTMDWSKINVMELYIRTDEYASLDMYVDKIKVTDPEPTIIVDQSGAGDYITIQAAVNAAGAGDIIEVKDGYYKESIRINTSGTASAPIVLRAENKGGAVIYGELTPSYSYGINIGTWPYNELAVIDSIVIDGFEIRDFYCGGIWINGKNCTIRNNNIHHNAKNEIEDAYGKDGIDGGWFNEKNVYERNEIHHNGRDDPEYGYADHGIYTYGNAPRMENNIMYGNSASGIQLAGNETEGSGCNAEIINNTFYDNKLFAQLIVWSSTEDFSVANAQIYNNIIAAPNENPDHGGIYIVTTGEGHFLKNNLYYETGGDRIYTRDGEEYTETGAIIDNPDVIDDLDYDYNLESYSPAIDSGTTDFYTIDFNGIPRTQTTIDIGAYSYREHMPLDEYAVFYVDLNENTGTTVNDQCYGNDGTVVNGAVWGNGISGSALDFDGTNDYVNFDKPAALELSGSRTISAWIKPEQHDPINAIVTKSLFGSSLFTYYGKIAGHIDGFNGDYAQSRSTETLTPGKWYHVAMTFDVEGDKNIHLYINGQETGYNMQDTMTGVPESTSAYSLRVGGDGSNYYFNGLIDEVKMFARPLNEQEIYNEYKKDVTVFSADFERLKDDTVTDLINGNNGTISGAVETLGISGKGLDFDGTNDRIDFGNPATLELSGSRTISAWIKPEQNDPINAIVAKNIWGSSLFTYYGHLAGHVGGTGEDYAQSRSAETLTPGKWYHVTMTFDIDGDKKVHLYINGEETGYIKQDAMIGSPASTSAYNFRIGADWSYWFNGIIDEVKLFRVALSEDQVFDEYSKYGCIE